MAQKTYIDTIIPTKKFACDLDRCKGACCTMPGHRGAPLLDAEVAEVTKAFPIIKKYLSDEHLAIIENQGMVQGTSGDFSTQCVHSRACVFVTFEDGIAKCAFEKAHNNHEITWPKPISCHLFPIRVDRGGEDRLRFEYIAECRPATERGEVENIFLVDFIKPSLIREYGEDWYNEFLNHCRMKRISSNVYSDV
ncbi:MAG: DUF3109 family protein [Ignavibacteriales bacterium]|nr:DUF3109 family protein [Ignavibacteriales bacterium]